MYDIQYLKQRKILLLTLIDLLEENVRCIECQTKESRRIVNTQNGLLGKIYVNLQKGKEIEKESFAELSSLESRLAKALCTNYPELTAFRDRG